MIRRRTRRTLLAMIGTSMVFLLLGCGEATNSTDLDAAETAAAKMEEEWGVTDAVKAAIEGVAGSEVDKNWLNAMCCYWGYGRKKNSAVEAFRLSQLLDDPLGRCQCMTAVCFWCGSGTEGNQERAVEFFQLSADRGCAAGIYRLVKAMRINNNAGIRIFTIS